MPLLSDVVIILLTNRFISLSGYFMIQTENNSLNKL